LEFAPRIRLKGEVISYSNILARAATAIPTNKDECVRDHTALRVFNNTHQSGFLRISSYYLERKKEDNR